MWDLGYGGTEWGLDEGHAVGDDEGDRPDRPTDQLIQIQIRTDNRPSDVGINERRPGVEIDVRYHLYIRLFFWVDYIICNPTTI